MARRRWFDPWVEIYLDEAADLGLVADREPVAKLIIDAVETVADRMRVTPATARGYLTEDQVRDLAREAAFWLVAEQPGANLLTAPRPVLASLAEVGQSLAAASVAGQIFIAAGDSTAAAQCLGLTAIGGFLLKDEASRSPLSLPTAWLARIARQLENAAAALEGGTPLPADTRDPSDDARAGVVRSLRTDAKALSAMIANAPGR